MLASLFGHITRIRKLRVLVQLASVSIGLVNNLTAQKRARGGSKTAWTRLEGPAEARLGTGLYDVGSRHAKGDMRGSGGCGHDCAAVGMFVDIIVRNLSDAVRRAATQE